jgi:hypothetical protein
MRSLHSTARRRLNSEIGQAASEFLEFFFQKIGSALLDGGCPCLASGHRWTDAVDAVFLCPEFLEINSRKSGWQASHTQSGKVSYRQARPRAINDKGQASFIPSFSEIKESAGA